MNRTIQALFITIAAFSVHSFAAINTCQVLLDPSNAPKIPVSTSQVIIVHSTTGFNAEITACERSGKIWLPAITPSIKGVIGTNGVAAIGEKKEGDRKTPAGIYPIGEAFGTQLLSVHMDYKYITEDDKFIDDIDSKLYNTWVTGPTDAKSYELMLIAPYKIGVVINYNMNPVVPGAGSAIFMHVWRTPTTSTAGCVAMNEASLLRVLNWLDKKQRPYIFIE